MAHYIQSTDHGVLTFVLLKGHKHEPNSYAKEYFKIQHSKLGHHDFVGKVNLRRWNRYSVRIEKELDKDGRWLDFLLPYPSLTHHFFLFPSLPPYTSSRQDKN